MDSKVAERLSLLMSRISAHLDQSTAYVRDTCSTEEFETYRQTVGRIMGAIYLDIEEKIYAEHPQLRPKQLDGTYELNPLLLEPAFYRRDDKSKSPKLVSNSERKRLQEPAYYRVA